jgi:hypothetical protein
VNVVAPAPVTPRSSLAAALTQLVTADTLSYLSRTAWLKAQGSAASGAPATSTELAMQCTSESATTAAAPAPAAASPATTAGGMAGAAAMGNAAAPQSPAGCEAGAAGAAACMAGSR